jgi:hypothetical protein
MYSRIFTLETLDSEGKLMERFEKEIENNPEYGEVECKKILIDNPDVRTVSIMSAEFHSDTGEERFMTNDAGVVLTDGAGEPRRLFKIVMRWDRDLNGQTFSETERDWPAYA